MTVIGTRPEIIRLSRVMAKLDEHLDHIIVHTGQNYDYELNQIFFDELGIRKPDYFLESAQPGQLSLPDRWVQLLPKWTRCWQKLNPMPCWCWETPTPAWLLTRPNVVKSRYFTWKPATDALISEFPRRLTAKSSTTSADINLPYSNIAREYLLREGFPPGSNHQNRQPHV